MREVEMTDENPWRKMKSCGISKKTGD